MKRGRWWVRCAVCVGLVGPPGCMSFGTPWGKGPPAVGEGAAPESLTAAAALEKKGQDAEAIAEYEKARRRDPRSPQVARRLAVLYDRTGQDARARAEYERLLRATPDDAALLNDLGYFHYGREQWADAEQCLRRAVQKDPGLRRAWVNLGLVLGRQGRFDESYEAFARVLSQAEAYSNLAVLLARQGRTAEAARTCERALALDPGLKQARAVLAHLQAKPPAPQGLATGSSPEAPPTGSLKF